MLKRMLSSLVKIREKTSSSALFLNKPATQEALYRQGNLFFDKGDYSKAIPLYLLAHKLGATPEIHVKLGYAYLALEELKRSEVCFYDALKIAPTFAPALTGLGNIRSKNQKYEESIEFYNAAIAASPSFVLAYNDRALSLTAIGHLEEAWADAEWRHSLPDTKFLYSHHYNKSRWDGSSLNGKRLLIHWEQGYGDIIQHLRFIPLVKTDENYILFECAPEIMRLAASVKAIDEIIQSTAKPVADTKFDFYLPLLSLPHVLRTKVETIPVQPYLSAPENSEEYFQYLRHSSKPLIGIVWKASATDPRRNCTFTDLIKLVDCGGQLISLQKLITEEEAVALANYQIMDAGNDCRDFADTAAAISLLDLVISVDTSVAHLAGALGKPVWLLLNEPAAERWMMGTDRSLWYPSMQIFRKKASEPWGLLIDQLKKQLTNLPKKHSTSIENE